VVGGTSKGPSERQRELGRRVRERRTKAGLSQEELAERAGLDRSYIGQVETGRRNANLDTLSRLAVALDIDLGTLTRGLQTFRGRT
jgi:transcriptional regulator with XRE-family HTH domain